VLLAAAALSSEDLVRFLAFKALRPGCMLHMCLRLLAACHVMLCSQLHNNTLYFTQGVLQTESSGFVARAHESQNLVAKKNFIGTFEKNVKPNLSCDPRSRMEHKLRHTPASVSRKVQGLLWRRDGSRGQCTKNKHSLHRAFEKTKQRACYIL